MFWNTGPRRWGRRISPMVWYGETSVYLLVGFTGWSHLLATSSQPHDNTDQSHGRLFTLGAPVRRDDLHCVRRGVINMQRSQTIADGYSGTRGNCGEYCNATIPKKLSPLVQNLEPAAALYKLIKHAIPSENMDIAGSNDQTLGLAHRTRSRLQVRHFITIQV